MAYNKTLFFAVAACLLAICLALPAAPEAPSGGKVTRSADLETGNSYGLGYYGYGYGGPYGSYYGGYPYSYGYGYPYGYSYSYGGYPYYGRYWGW